MTAKRFVAYFDKEHNYIIQDLVNEDEYQVGYVHCDEDVFLELVNAIAETSCDCITDCEIVVRKLKEENEQLKQQVNCHKSRIQLLSPLLDLADTIIDLSDDEKAKAFWEKRNNEVEQEWNKLLKGDVE